MDDLDRQVLEHLDFAFRRDEEKGGIGTRSARQVADRVGIAVETARRRLNDLFERDMVIGYEGGDWRISDEGRVRIAAMDTPFCPNE